MEPGRGLAATPLGIGLIGGVVGGLIVGLFVLIAVVAGWFDSDGGSKPGVATLSAAPLPLAQPEDGGKALGVRGVYERGGPAVAFIEAERDSAPPSPFGPPQGGAPPGGIATGSGFVIDEQGHILTNAHVVAGSEQIRVTLRDDSAVDAELIGQDPSTDVALLEVDPSEIELSPVELGDSSQAQIGDPVVAIGNPFGLDRTVTTGIVSALQREIQAPNGFAITDVIQTDASINPGNSGGPLLDARGRVIGINSQIQTAGGGGSVGVGFAVPINTASDVAEQILEDGEVRRPSLGINGVGLDPELASALGADADQGVLVQEVVEDGPAARAGIRGGDDEVEVEGQAFLTGGDIIVTLDGEDVRGVVDIITIVNRKQPGDVIPVEVVRDGARERLTVELGVRPGPEPA